MCPSSWDQQCRRLLADLPAVEELDAPGDLDRLSRAVLSLVMGPAVRAEPVPPDPTRCPNCDGPVTAERSPYCGDGCREQAGFVRQTRAGIADGTLLDLDRQIALGQVLWHALGGGYPRRQALILPRSFKEAMKREEGRCQLCGGPADRVEQIGSGCGRSINLRAVCEGCAFTRPYWDQEFRHRRDVSALLDDVRRRVLSDVPVRCCDDSQRWDWRQYVLARKTGEAYLWAAN